MEHYREDRRGQGSRRRAASYVSDVDQSRLASETDFTVSDESSDGVDESHGSSTLSDADADRLGSTTDLGGLFSAARTKKRVSTLPDFNVGSGLGGTSTSGFAAVGDSSESSYTSTSGNPFQQTDLERLAGTTDFGSAPQMRMQNTETARKAQAKAQAEAQAKAQGKSQAQVQAQRRRVVRKATGTPQMPTSARVTVQQAQPTRVTTQATPNASESEPRVAAQAPTAPRAQTPTPTSRPTPEPDRSQTNDTDQVEDAARAAQLKAEGTPTPEAVVVAQTPAASSEADMPRAKAPEPRPVEPARPEPPKQSDVAGKPRLVRTPKHEQRKQEKLGLETPPTSVEKGVPEQESKAATRASETPRIQEPKKAEAAETPEPTRQADKSGEREQTSAPVVSRKAEPTRTVEPGVEDAPNTRDASSRPNIRFADSVEEVLARRLGEVASRPTSQTPAPAEPARRERTAVAEAAKPEAETSQTNGERSEPDSRSEFEDVESRRDRTRREGRNTRRANGHVTLGSFLGRVGRGKETPTPEERPAASRRSSTQGQIATQGSSPASAPLEDKVESRAEARVESEPKAEPEASSVSGAVLESEMTTIIDKETRQVPEAPKRQTSVIITQVPSPADEAPVSHREPEPQPESQPEPEPEPVRWDTGEQPSTDQPEAQSDRHSGVVESFTGALARINLGSKASESETDDRAARAGASAANGQKTPRQQRMLILAIATVVVAAAVTGVVFLISSAGAGRNTATTALQQMVTSMVYRGDFVDAIAADGTVVPLIVMDVNGEVDGTVENLVIGQGSYVTAGDTLFKIKNDALEMAVTEASARLTEAERAVNDTDLAYRQAQADYQNAWNIAAMSNNWTTFDQTGLTNAINAAAARRSEAVATRDAASTALATAQASLGQCDVRAPISGIVTECNVANGVMVGAGGATGPLLKVGDVTQMKVTVLVGENYMPFIHQGQVATVTFPGLPGITTTASVNAISSTPSGVAADATGMASYAVEFMLAASDPNLRPGMTATLNVVLQSAGDSLIIPSKAIWQEVGEDGSTHYFVNVVTESGELMKSEVSIIAQNTEEAAVWGDIAEGDIVRVNN